MGSTNSQESPAVLITGSSSGIGAACAVGLDRRGFRVFAGVRSQADAERLRQQASPRLTPVMLDVTAPASIAAVAATLSDALGSRGLAGLVNNAGVAVCGPLETLPLAELRRQLEVNCVGPIAVTQAMLPLLRAARGRIVNMSSANGALAPPYMGPYAASKFALEALSDALRLELRRTGIKVCLVEPGVIATPIWEKSIDAADQLLGRLPPPAVEFYRDDLEALRRSARRLAAMGWPAESVVRAVIHALTARHPKTRYYGDWQTRLCFKGFKIVPDPIRDWLVRRGLELK
jgi:NAD(P)-dependent dehydrogenase (short-subunit alcohol dehydrogenase family)